MRILTALLPVALVVGAPAAAQTFKPAVVGADVSPLETLWHVRVALNVAALGCRDADEAATVAAYNTLIRRQSAVLAAANDAVSARYKAQYGARWQDVRERDMTRLYNFFAQPAAQAEFCASAKSVLAQIDAVDSAALIDFAKTELPALEAPFWSPPADQFAGGSSRTSVAAIAAAAPVAPRGF